MNGPALLALQLVDTQLDALEGRRRRLPERAAVDAATGDHRTLLAERTRQQALVAAANDSIEQAEHAGAELDTKQRRLEAQLKTVIAPREAEALMSEIATLRAKHGDLDDVELEAMERQGEAETALAALAEREPELLATLAAATALLDEAEAVLAAEAASLGEQRAAATAALSEHELSTYAALKARHGGVAIAALERHRCTACHVDLSPMEYDAVKSTTGDDLPECPHCARMLVV